MKRILVVEDDRATRYLLTSTLKGAGYEVTAAGDGLLGLRRLRKESFDLVLLDVWMPRLSGLEVLAKMREEGLTAKAVVMTSDDTSETMLHAIRQHAWQYLAKPVQPRELLHLVENAVSSVPVPPIEVLSAIPDWVELLLPCERNTAERIQSFVARLDAGLPEDVRDNIGLVFHEMLMNAIEWGGKLDPNRKVRISCVRAKRMLLYRIADPGEGFDIDRLRHAAISNPDDDPIRHMAVREEYGIRPGGFGLAMTRSLVDELIYNEARNEVICIKYLD